LRIIDKQDDGTAHRVFHVMAFKRLLQCLDVDASFAANLSTVKVNFSIDRMLMVRQKLQRGTQQNLSMSYTLIPSLRFQRVTDETDPWDKNGKLKKMMVQEVSTTCAHNPGACQRCSEGEESMQNEVAKISQRVLQNIVSRSRFEFNSFCVAVG